MKISIRELGKRFNREWIFRNLTLELTSNTPYVLAGPNGSGKSTLLQILWGQTPPSKGNIQYESDGTILSTENIYKELSIAAPYMDLIEEFTLDEMIRFHFKFKKPQKGTSVDQVIDLMELSHARSKPIGKFSSGMKQRVKLGLAFATHSKLICLDEPCTNLDKKAIEWYHQLLERVPCGTLLILASNQEYEHPGNCVKINILDYK